MENFAAGLDLALGTCSSTESHRRGLCSHGVEIEGEIVFTYISVLYANALKADQQSSRTWMSKANSNQTIGLCENSAYTYRLKFLTSHPIVGRFEFWAQRL